jgi:hypothetical protein
MPTNSILSLEVLLINFNVELLLLVTLFIQSLDDATKESPALELPTATPTWLVHFELEIQTLCIISKSSMLPQSRRAANIAVPRAQPSSPKCPKL